MLQTADPSLTGLLAMTLHCLIHRIWQPLRLIAEGNMFGQAGLNAEAREHVLFYSNVGKTTHGKSCA